MRKFSLAFSLCLILICRVHAQEPVRLTLTFLGDIMAHTVNYRVGDFHDVYRGLEDTLLGDDLTFANLEFPVDPTRPLQSYPQFNGSRDNWKAAVESGIDVFSLANNHTFDQGTEGILQTLRAAAWVEESSGRRITVSGTRGNPESPFRAQEVLVKGVRIGFIAATQFINQAVPCPYVNIVGLGGAAADRFVSYVGEARREFDALIVSYHCGVEFSAAPSRELAGFFKRLAENGALIVFGHHPHVFQAPYAMETGGESRIILPSMGNFISGMAWFGPSTPPPPAYASAGDSALVQVEVVREGGRTRIAGFSSLPIADYVNEKGEIVVGKLEDITSGKIALGPAWAAYFRGRDEHYRRILGGGR